MNLRLQRLLKLHKLYAPADEHGSDGGGTDAGVLEDEGAPVDNELQVEEDLGEVVDGDGSYAEGEESEGVVVSIGDEPVAQEEEEQARAPEWLRELRKSNREKDRKLREQEAEITRLRGNSAPAEVTLGTKPTLASCDFDEAKFEADLEAWHARKQTVEAQQREKQAAEQKAKDAWQSKLDGYSKSKAALKVSDFEDAEAVAKSLFSITQQGVIVAGSENAATLIYALGKNPKKAKELAALTDPVQFAWKAAQLETQLKVTPRKAAPVPERTIRGGATGAAIDSALSKLQAEADKTGDRSKVAAYLRNKKQA
jgi:hypothetical protein